MNIKKDNINTTSKIDGHINFNGNWNHKNKELGYISGKPIAVVKIDNLEIVFGHKDIFDLIKIYHQADKLAINMIVSEYINTGEVINFETPFLKKIKQLLEELENGNTTSI